jgi:hypothetical protein
VSGFILTTKYPLFIHTQLKSFDYEKWFTCKSFYAQSCCFAYLLYAGDDIQQVESTNACTATYRAAGKINMACNDDE